MTEAQSPSSSGKTKAMISTSMMMFLVSMFSLLRSIKPSSSYIHPFVHAADEIRKNDPESHEIYQDYIYRALPAAQLSQLLFYVVVVFFSSKIGFLNILHVDYICQLFNLAACVAIYFDTFYSAKTLLFANFMYGISTAASHVFHNYVFSVFEKKNYQKMSSLSRGMAMFGHMLGAFGAFLYLCLFSKENDYIKAFLGFVKKSTDQVNLSDAQKKIVQSIYDSSFNRYTILFFISMGFVMSSAIIANLFPKVKEIKRSFSLNDIAIALSQLKRRKVAFWAFSWSLNFIVMLYSKTWSSMLWKHHQNRLSVSANNGLYDMLAYFLSFIGSMMPTYVVKFGFGVSVFMQLLVLSLSICLCLLQSYEEFTSINWYYYLHPLFSMLVYYSLTFQNSELAKSIEHSQIKLLFNLLTFGVFLAQYFLNRFLDGCYGMPPVVVSHRYVLLSIFLMISFFVVFVGFVGISGEEADSDAKHEQKKKNIEREIVEEEKQGTSQSLKND